VPQRHRVFTVPRLLRPVFHPRRLAQNRNGFNLDTGKTALTSSPQSQRIRFPADRFD